jgi:uncharacterized protein
MHEPAESLPTILRGMGCVAVAVSGGIDSLTLATLAHRTLGRAAVMYHAVSAAVPEEATARVRAQAGTQGWRLVAFDAGEFADPRYRANPVNRCFYCKTNLYGAIARHTARQIVSGTNLDDLGEYRPGLEAARNVGARHPFVEAGLAKPDIRRLAAELGLGALAALPAAPCLSSRIETGLAIEAPVLAMVHAVERLMGAAVRADTVRCRVRASGTVVELDAQSLARLDNPRRTGLVAAIAALGAAQPVRFAPYRNGSAFVQSAAAPAGQ